jgi:replicative superfamily II helicase
MVYEVNQYISLSDTALISFQVALVLIDEVHLLNESRGAALEAGVVSRIRMISALTAMQEV